jgi:hypothetical protein
MNWELLRELRSRFLSETIQEGPDYWKSTEHLDAYDATFAQRIGGKWDAVLREIPKGRPYLLGTVVEWGCGTGIATRKMLEVFPFEKVQLWDRSRLARDSALAPGGSKAGPRSTTR